MRLTLAVVACALTLLALLLYLQVPSDGGALVQPPSPALEAEAEAGLQVEDRARHAEHRQQMAEEFNSAGDSSETESDAPSSREAHVVLAGRVLYEQRPLPGAEVVAYRGNVSGLATGDLPRPFAKVRTDARGEFSIEVPRDVSLLAEKQEMGGLDFVYLSSASSTMAELASTIRGLELALWDLQPIEGIVLSPMAEAVAGAEVQAKAQNAWQLRRTAMSAECSYLPRPARRWKSATDGLFRGRLPASGAWIFEAKEGRRRARLEFAELAATRFELHLVEPSQGPEQVRLFGRVTDLSGKPLPDAEVQHLERRTRSAGGGEWSFSVSKRENPSVLRAAAEGYAIVSKQLDALVWDTGPIELVLTPAVSIRGQLLGVDGKPLAEQMVVLEGEPTVPGFDLPPKNELMLFGRSSAMTDEAGRFEFASLEAREYRLVAEHEETGALALAVVLAPAKHVELVLGDVDFDGVWIRGKLLDALSGEPLAGASITASKRADIEIYEAWYGVRSDRSKPTGEFELRGLEVGEYSIRARLAGYASRTVLLGELEHGEHEARVELYPERSLHLTVTDPSGAATANVMLSVRDPNGKLLSLRSGPGAGSSSAVFTGSTGDAHIHGLPAARVTVEARGSYGQPTFVQEIDLVPERVHELTLRLEVYPYPAAEVRHVRLNLRSATDLSLASQSITMQLFDAEQRVLSRFEFRPVDGGWENSIHGARLESEGGQLHAILPIKQGPCAVELELPGRSVLRVDIPTDLGPEGLDVDL